MTPDELRRIADALLRLDTLAAHITDDYLAAEIRQAQASLGPLAGLPTDRQRAGPRRDAGTVGLPRVAPRRALTRNLRR